MMKSYTKHATTIIVLILAFLALTLCAVNAGQTTRVSVASDGTQGNYRSGYYSLSISADGRYVAFSSYATNLVAGDTNGREDVFVHDRQTGQTTRVSVSSGGMQGNDDSYYPSISSDGRYVAFVSYATNLVTGDANESEDVLVRDRQTGLTTRISVSSSSMEGNNDSFSPSISADGRYVAFESYATNLVIGDTNTATDIFVRDRQTGQTTRVSVASDGTQGNDDSSSPSISADGQYVAFESWAPNLVTGDTNGSLDVFVHGRQTGQTTRVSVSSSGVQGDKDSCSPSVSADGRFIAFNSDATNLVTGDTNGYGDVFVRDLQIGQTSRVSVSSDGSQGDDWSGYSGVSINADGQFVAFNSDASNLVSGDTNGYGDVFVHDRQNGHTTRASVSSDGTQGNEWSGDYDISVNSDGQFVVFNSNASNLVADDTNGCSDVFMHISSDMFSISGRVQLQDFNPSRVSGHPIEVELRKQDGSTITKNANLNADGNYAILAEEGTYDIAFKASHWLKKLFPSPVAIYQNVSGINISLTNGDCNEDNGVDEVDYALLSNSWYQAEGDPKYNAQTDLNGDGGVDEVDYAILSNAWYTAGD